MVVGAAGVGVKTGVGVRVGVSVGGMGVPGVGDAQAVIRTRARRQKASFGRTEFSYVSFSPEREGGMELGYFT